MSQDKKLVEEITKEETDAMALVLDGADIFDYGLANSLRKVERVLPECIVIRDALYEYPGAERQPYFGAILTGKGKKYLEELEADRPDGTDKTDEAGV